MARIKIINPPSNKRIIEDNQNELQEKPISNVGKHRLRTGSEPEVFSGFTAENKYIRSNIEPKDVLIKDIVEREENNFIMSGIEELAEGIRKNGQLQEILIQEVNKKLICVVGHRRLAAMRLLHEQYPDEPKFAKIRACFLPQELSSEEIETIYRTSNTQSRNVTVYEILLNMNVKDFDFANPVYKQKYIDYMYSDEEKEKLYNGEIKDKFNQSSKINYFAKRVKNEYPLIENSERTTKNIIELISRSSDELKKAILKNYIYFSDARMIYSKTIDEQKKILSTAIEMMNSSPSNHVATKEEREKVKQDIENYFYKSSKSRKPTEKKDENVYAKINKDIKEIQNFVSKVSNAISTLDRDTLNGNQKEFIDAVNKAFEMLDKATKLPRK